jgi:hypothetical protein
MTRLRRSSLFASILAGLAVVALDAYAAAPDGYKAFNIYLNQVVATAPNPALLSAGNSLSSAFQTFDCAAAHASYPSTDRDRTSNKTSLSIDAKITAMKAAAQHALDRQSLAFTPSAYSRRGD